ncbi:alpha-L-rhamnosidase C-terminal domain-containing protein [Streptomyces mexicanus]|uniref:alpha-L-rhamnosidase C-terminal domain-containing protein n=1 Tax=Streptomyces mexicanus TaxID=178566 RepID=UPI0036B0C82E
MARTAWRRDGDRFRLSVDVPAGSTAEVRLPSSGRPVQAPAGARPLRTGGGDRRAVFPVGSGHWECRTVMPPA